MQRIDYPPLIQELIRQLRRMPGIGPRSAERIALWIVQRKEARADQIAEAILKTVSGIRSCVRCGFFSEADQCAICSDPGRDTHSLCVVEQPTDILSLERSGAFRGLYHSLGGRLSPLDHIGPEDLRIDSLVRRVKENQFHEVIFALSLDVEGEATLSYLGDLLKPEGVNITRIAQGLPAGSGLETADELTLARAFSGRTIFQRGS
jgi:recombination protein RecR